MEAVEQACRCADDLAIARERYRATREPADLRAVGLVAKLLSDALSVLGFDPTARARLGVGEVRQKSKLEELLEARGRRSGGA
jgi:hypothetical protein